MSLKQHDEYLEQFAEARAEAAYFKSKADEFLRDLMPQLSTPHLEWLHQQIEVELRERDTQRDFGIPF